MLQLWPGSEQKSSSIQERFLLDYFATNSAVIVLRVVLLNT